MVPRETVSFVFQRVLMFPEKKSNKYIITTSLNMVEKIAKTGIFIAICKL